MLCALKMITRKNLAATTYVALARDENQSRCNKFISVCHLRLYWTSTSSVVQVIVSEYRLYQPKISVSSTGNTTQCILVTKSLHFAC